MNKIHIVAAREPAVKESKREIAGLVLPFEKPGFTNAGAVTVKAGTVTIPDDLSRVKLLRNHSTESDWQPVGYAVAADETPAGLRMTFKLSDTPDGHLAMQDVTEKVRDALSVELVHTDVDAEGVLTAGELTAVALVPIPAFDDARVDLITASQVIDEEPDEEPDEPPTETSNDKEKETPTMNKHTTAAQAPAGLHAAGETAPLTFTGAVNAIAAMNRGETMTAALADVTHAAHPATRAPEWLGELWSGLAFERKIVNTMTHTDLKGMKAVGWRWKKRPEVADYDGNKKAIPTGNVETEPVEMAAKRLAAGWDFDRAYLDFGETEFLSSFFEAVREDYALKTEQRAAQSLISWAATESVHKAEKQPDMLRAAAMANVLFDDAINTKPTTFLVNSMDRFKLLEFTKLDTPEFLELVGVDPRTFITSPLVPAGKMIAYTRPAVQFSELAGSPIRVSAQHLAHGGVDEAVFGYWSALLLDPRGIAQIEFGTDTAPSDKDTEPAGRES